MSDSTTSDPKYNSWQDAALGGNLLSYAWEHRPSVGQLVPGYSPDEPWWQKIPDIGSIPARMALGPLMQGGEAMRRWMEGDQGPETKQLLTSSVLGLETGGLARSTPGPAAFGAWHGSRHLFPPEPGAPLGAFKDEKIGTGEGAQAYGWGHYVAGKKETGEDYKTAGGDDYGTLQLDGKTVQSTDFMNSDPHIWHALEELKFQGGDPRLASAFLIEHSNYLNKEGWLAEDAKEQANYFKLAKENMAGAHWLTDNASRVKFAPNEGHLYQVHVVPDEHELLDWDKPLSEQSPKVKEALQNIHPDVKERIEDHADERGQNSLFFAPEAYTGKDLVRILRHHDVTDGPQEASEVLNEAGIPGLKYKDRQSRKLPDDHPDVTRNYVLFHPQHLQIVGRDGVRHTLEPVDHDPFTEGK